MSLNDAKILDLLINCLPLRAVIVDYLDILSFGVENHANYDIGVELLDVLKLFVDHKLVDSQDAIEELDLLPFLRLVGSRASVH